MDPYRITCRLEVFYYALRILIGARSDPNGISNGNLYLVHTYSLPGTTGFIKSKYLV